MFHFVIKIIQTSVWKHYFQKQYFSKSLTTHASKWAMQFGRKSAILNIAILSHLGLFSSFIPLRWRRHNDFDDIATTSSFCTAQSTSYYKHLSLDMVIYDKLKTIFKYKAIFYAKFIIFFLIKQFRLARSQCTSTYVYATTESFMCWICSTAMSVGIFCKQYNAANVEIG